MDALRSYVKYCISKLEIKNTQYKLSAEKNFTIIVVGDELSCVV